MQHTMQEYRAVTCPPFNGLRALQFASNCITTLETIMKCNVVQGSHCSLLMTARPMVDKHPDHLHLHERTFFQAHGHACLCSPYIYAPSTISTTLAAA